MQNVGKSNEVLTVPFPEHWNRFPTVEIVDTDYAFDMHIDPGENEKWLFNTKLNKMFIKLKSIMKVTVAYNAPVDDSTKVFLRAMILFASSDYIQQQVKRCMKHRDSTDDQAVPPEHILRCFSSDTQYVGNENGQLFGERLSLVVPMGRPAVDDDGKTSKSIVFDFLCQNSCSSGISRKSTLIVFTLENERQEIIGKRILPFTVCSNPKREMAREMSRENSLNLRKLESSSVNRLSEVKVESPDTSDDEQFFHDPYTVTLTMPNIDSMQHVMKCAFNAISGLEVKGETEKKIKTQYLEHFQNLLEPTSSELSS